MPRPKVCNYFLTSFATSVKISTTFSCEAIFLVFPCVFCVVLHFYVAPGLSQKEKQSFYGCSRLWGRVGLYSVRPLKMYGK